MSELQTRFQMIRAHFSEIEQGAEWLDKVVATVHQKHQEGFSKSELAALLKVMNEDKMGEKLDDNEQVDVIIYACGLKTSNIQTVGPIFTDKAGLINGLAKGLAQSNLPLEAASSMLVAVNAGWKDDALDPQKFTVDFTNGWQQYRTEAKDTIEESIISAKELMEKNMPLPETVIEGLMYQGEIGMLAGWQGRGKSFFALGLAISIVAEQPEFCGYKLKKFGDVIYIDYEQTQRQINARLNKYPLGQLLKTAKYKLHFVTDAPAMTNKKFLARLRNEISDKKPLIVIVDNMTFAHTGDENSSRDVAMLMKDIKAIVTDLSTNAILLHHFRKGVRFETLSLEHLSGSGVWSRPLNWALLIAASSKDQELRIFKADKLRDWPEVHKRAFAARMGEGGSFIYEGIVEDETEHLPQATMTAQGGPNWKLIMKAGVEMKREQVFAEMRAQKITASPATMARWLKTAVESNILSSPREGYYVRETMDSLKDKISTQVSKE